ncbi:hypothetical protein KVF89_16335 [Nocardioides carbamazepini]|uniref:hypothetical protein n=1 Tax=Nocardioides carbamazepini TaxID=2854259 RepID=UPI00214A4F98|nr:hypothetical protein [Nocardioides carbamazepini]MCR1784109.1 hypothetical protein [Nocardioides carbamazepini]
MNLDFRGWTPDKFGVIPTRPTGGTMPRPTRATKPTTGTKPTRRKITKPKAAKPTITGAEYTPLTPGQRLQIEKDHPPREWKGDAREVETAPCGVCGGPVSTATMRYSAPFAIHPECHGLSSVASRLCAAAPIVLGAAITREDARVIASAVDAPAYQNLPTSQPVIESGRVPRPWAHLDKREIKRAVSALPRLRKEAGLDPVRCSDGPCAWCGVREAIGWIRHGHKWSDGQPAPLCGLCTDMYERYGSSPVEPMYLSDYTSQRRIGYDAMVGRTPSMGRGAPGGFRLYAEVADAARDGYVESWGYIPAEQRPGTTEHGLAQARHRIEDQQRRADEQARRQAAEQAEAQAWGWGHR